MKDEFINIAAHEFKSPIQSILGYLELARTDSEYVETDKNRGGLIDAAYRNATRLYRLTKNILEVTRIDSRSFYFNNKVFDLKKLILNVTDDYRTRSTLLSRMYITSDAASNQYVVRFSNIDQEEGLFVDADEERITEVLVNLLDNATKFTKCGTITVIATRDNTNNQVSVRVIDTGTGVDPKIVSQLFTKFSSRSSRGTGLGLYISKSIMDAHVVKYGLKAIQMAEGLPLGLTCLCN